VDRVEVDIVQNGIHPCLEGFGYKLSFQAHDQILVASVLSSDL
jgi:hypothetical protein